MSDITTLMMAAAGQGGGGAETDPNFNQTVLLLHGDGTNGAQNNTFLDSSSNTFTITRNGNTTQGTFSPFSAEAGKWSVYIGGVDDWVDIVNSGALLGSGAWTMECWFYATTTSVQRQLLDFRYPSGGQNLSVFLQSSNEIAYWNGTVRITGGTVEPNQWNHVLCSRDGSNDVRLFLNGVQIGSEYNDTTNYTTAVCRFGCANTGADFEGYISNVRLVNGTAVQTSGFTVPTSPLTEVSGTTFLGLQSNRFVDNSTTPVTSVTPNDAVSIQPFSPFAPSAAYDASVNGGSGYWDNSGDSLVVANSSSFAFGTGDFTVEFFYRGIDTSRNFSFPSGGSTGYWSLILLNGTLYWQSAYNATNKLTASATSIVNQAWNHVAVVRDSGTLRFFFNGVSVASTSDTTDYNGTAGTRSINAGNNAAGSYLSSYRIVKGTAIYPGSTSFTPPTAPLTAVSGTELLLNFTNAGIFDNTGKNNLETVGNAQVDTGTKKYGTGALEFDGVDDSIKLVPDAPDSFKFGSGPWTIEMWIYPNSLPSNKTILARDNNSGADLLVRVNSSGSLLVYLTSNGSTFEVSGTSAISGASISASQWNHIAITKDASNVTRKFINGVGQTISTTFTTMFDSAKPVFIGIRGNGSEDFDGYIDDVRVTKGVARYTADFTPPTAAFPDL